MRRVKNRRTWLEAPWETPFVFRVGSLRVMAGAARTLREMNTCFLSMLCRHANGDRGLATNGDNERVSIYPLASKKVIVMTAKDETTIALEEEV